VVTACRANGILTRALGIGALQVSPALVLTGDELDELRDGVLNALAAA
jgi:adenosylmethionine-8-amino-7-oxononanoate aminotransferase